MCHTTRIIVPWRYRDVWRPHGGVRMYPRQSPKPDRYQKKMVRKAPHKTLVFGSSIRALKKKEKKKEKHYQRYSATNISDNKFARHDMYVPFRTLERKPSNIFDVSL